ILSALVGIL
nr:Chain C, GP2 PEPTIDE [synthetic construct]1EEZ_F Chain F, GP2 PEPTIDE [synthetic construct]